MQRMLGELAAGSIRVVEAKTLDRYRNAEISTAASWPLSSQHPRRRFCDPCCGSRALRRPRWGLWLFGHDRRCGASEYRVHGVGVACGR